MPVIAMTPAVSQPFFPTDDQLTSAASTPTGGRAPVSGGKPETVTVTAPASSDDTGKSFFDNLLDVINPLEHLPIVSAIYSNLTGDKPNDFTQVAGDTLYGGPLGLLSSVGNLVFRDVTGKTIGDTVWSWVAGKDGDTKMAANTSASRQPMKPSSDLFSFLRANAGSESKPAQLASSNAPAAASIDAASSSPAAPFTTVPLPAAPVQTAAASQATTPAPAPASNATVGAAPRLLNPLPPRGAPPAHITPSENVRAAGLASMIANRAHLHAPASEGNAPAIQPAGSIMQLPAAPAPQATNAEVASDKPATVPVDSNGIPTLNSNGEQALLAALNKNGISSAIGQQALMAYQKTMAMSPDPSNAAALSAALH